MYAQAKSDSLCKTKPKKYLEIKVLKKIKKQTRFWLGDSSLLKVTTLSFHYNPKMPPKSGMCIPHCGPEKTFKNFDLGYQLIGVTGSWSFF